MDGLGGEVLLTSFRCIQLCDVYPKEWLEFNSRT